MRSKPIIGYLHTGMEKTGEELTYLQGATNVTRMDYAVAALQRAGLLAGRREAARRRELPERAMWIRMLLCELNRISSHLLFLATNGMDIGGVVDDALRLARARGAAAVPREGHRPADEPQLHPRPAASPPTCPTAGATTCSASSTSPPPRLEEYDMLHDRPADLAGAAAGRRRDHHRGGASPSAPPARSCAPPATPGTCAATCPTSPTTRSTSTSSSARYGDCFDRYAIRLNEIRESIRIVPPDPRPHAARATTASRTRRSRRRRGPASTSRWRR